MAPEVRSIYTPSRTQKSDSKRTLLMAGAITLIVIAIILLYNKFFGSSSTADLNIDVYYGTAQVYLDDELLGETPILKSGIKSGERTVKLTNEMATYEVPIQFLKTNKIIPEVLIRRDLGISNVFSSGLNLWYSDKDSDTVLTVVSEPSDVTITINDEDVGQAPYSTSDLTPGSYVITISKDGYEPQSAEVEIRSDYKLNLSVNLFPIPAPQRVTFLGDSVDIYNISSDNEVLLSDKGAWAKGYLYWNETRGVNYNGNSTQEVLVDFFIDEEGQVYDSIGNVVTDLSDESLTDSLEGEVFIAYLNGGDSISLSTAAKNSYVELTNGVPASTSTTATINETGLGFLRVRSEPSLNGEELAQAIVGQTYPVLDTAPGWVKIQFSSTISGWASDTYITLNSPDVN